MWRVSSVRAFSVYTIYVDLDTRCGAIVRDNPHTVVPLSAMTAPGHNPIRNGGYRAHVQAAV